MNRQQRKSSLFQKYRFEQLESRDLLAGHPGFSHAAFAAAQASQRNAPALIGAQSAGARAAAANAAAQLTTLTASLTDGTLSAAVTFKSGTIAGVATASLKVNVTGGTAGDTLSVTLNGTEVGTITVAADGTGSLSLSTLPTDLTVAAGTAIGVGTLSGTLEAATTPTHPGRGGCGGAATSSSSFTATLADAGGTGTGTVTFKTTTVKGVTSSTLTATVTGATASTDLDVTIDGTSVGTLTTDANGAGTVTITSNLPAAKAGSVIGVGSLSGTLASSTTTATASSLRAFRHR